MTTDEMIEYLTGRRPDGMGAGVLSDPKMLRTWIARAVEIGAKSSGCGGAEELVRVDMLLGLSGAADAALYLLDAMRAVRAMEMAEGDG